MHRGVSRLKLVTSNSYYVEYAIPVLCMVCLSGPENLLVFVVGRYQRIFKIVYSLQRDTNEYCIRQAWSRLYVECEI